MTYLGEYGGRVLRQFKGDVPWIVGAEIPPEVALQWPIANRKALHATHKVEWWGPPVGEVPKQRPAPKKAAENKLPTESAPGRTNRTSRRGN